MIKKAINCVKASCFAFYILEVLFPTPEGDISWKEFYDK